MYRQHNSKSGRVKAERPNVRLALVLTSEALITRCNGHCASDTRSIRSSIESLRHFAALPINRRAGGAPRRLRSSPSSKRKRLEVMCNVEAGYFIRGWQEIGDQVRQFIFDDARYREIKRNWPSR